MPQNFVNMLCNVKKVKKKTHKASNRPKPNCKVKCQNRFSASLGAGRRWDRSGGESNARPAAATAKNLTLADAVQVKEAESLAENLDPH